MPTKRPPLASVSLPRGYAEAFEEWQDIRKWMALAKEREMHLRLFLDKRLFPSPVAGVSRVAVMAGGKSVEVAATHKQYYKVDKDAYMKNEGRYEASGIPVNKVLDWKPELCLGVYKGLPENKQKIFASCLTITSGTPSLEIK